ncbi:hypothetical protein NC652_040092 [Populus alba x Populus x berolinensis]|nr:hypothetical protein NC652_040092 [Populus alba x Populus x berolinensis]
MGLNRFSLPAVAVIMMINAMLLSQGCLEEERIALLQIKTSFGGNPNLILSPVLSWGKDALCCSWEGVTCSNSTTRRVVEIHLSYSIASMGRGYPDASMVGWYPDASMGGRRLDASMGGWYLNASIFLPFQELNVLDLSGKGIAGCVANEGFERLSRLTKLEVLYLDGNNLNNSILSSLKKLSSLKHLSLIGNQLQGSINTKGSEGPSRLNKLETLDLSLNNLNNSILSSLKGLSSLKYLYLHGNELQGSINMKGSEGPSRLNKLETLDLSLNNLNNSILSSLKGLSSLKYLYLQGNELQGSINMKGSEGPSRLNKLETLDLSLNNLNNSILSSLKGLSSLKHLYLYFNQLQGSINMKGSEGPSRLNKLETLDLSLNNLNNSILSSLKGLSSLKYLYLQGNELQGSINMKEIDSLSELEVLSLSGNKIHNFSKSRENTGFSNLSVLHLESVTSKASVFILQSLSAFPNLKALSLRDNYNPYGFGQGELPNLKFLEQLDLTNSSLVNYNFLQTVGKFTSLKSLVLPYSGLSGPIFAPHGLCELKLLQELDISHNDLNGSLPSCLSNLTNLQVLDISFNNFTGNISLSPIGSLASIQDLKISDNHFRIPISLGPFFNLSKLKYLNGDRNEIYESTELVHNLIPRFQLQSLSLACTGSGKTFPKYLYYQHDLQFVDLSNIKMTGEFPSWLLQNNTKLEVLYLVNNSLSGSFQLANHSLTSLLHLDISRNRIHNQIPTEIGACFPRLVFLNLSRNDFSGSIPSSISNMSLLEVLDLSNNGLSSNIPEQLVEGCLSLGVLMLSNNHLKGQLFWKNFNLKYLTDLILRGNQLTGILPNSLSNCSELQSLDVSLNNLSGKIPRWIGYMSHLQYLDLSENNLFGSLPSSFCSSRKITEVYLSKNKLEGSLIGALDGCLSLKRLDLSHNYFRGGIPESIGSLLELSFLLLGYNNLEAEIPRQLCKLEKLSFIDLSHNNLSGHILPCLHPRSEWSSKWKSPPSSSTTSPPPPKPMEDPSVNKSVEITTKSISYSFKGIILNLISGIDLSCNNLTGEIPFELGNLNNIKLLNLSYNSLTGPIPPTLSNLKEVETLDLSYNNLNGEIPPQLLDLNFLSAFSVAHNNLSGKTPEMVAQFSTFNESCYEGNPLLCGPPLAKNCTGGIPPSPLPRSQTHKKEENGVIDMEAFYVTFSVAYIMVLLAIGAVLYINPQWRQAWFYFIGESINNCYYFLVDNLPVPARFRRFQPCV